MTGRQFVGRVPETFGFSAIRYEKSGSRATITFNRPEVLNEANYQVLSEMNQALKDASWDDSVGVLVLTGAGERAFCTGADLREQEQFLERPRDYWKWMVEFNEGIPAQKALEWGFIIWVVPRAELDAQVDEVVDKLIHKFPGKSRYTKQQLNFWRDLSWHPTIGHGRGWLSIHQK